MPSDKSKDPDQKPEATTARPFSSPGFAKVMDGIVGQLFDQLHDQQRLVELAGELKREADLKKAAHPTPRRSLDPAPPADPKPRATDIKKLAPVVEIRKPRR
jgi:hypothetical protein